MKIQHVIAIIMVTILAGTAQSEENTPVDTSSVISSVTSTEVILNSIDDEAVLAKYDFVDPDKIVPTKLLKKAILAFDKQKDNLKKTDVVSIIDYSKRSDQKRFYIVNMKTGVVQALHVAHGKGSDPDFDGFAQKFSNTPESLMTSLGFYVTAETYHGQHGRSLRLDGVSKSNSNARERAIVIHGAAYVSDAQKIQGRSFGCPAVSQRNIDKLIDTIGGGSLILAGLSKE